MTLTPVLVLTGQCAEAIDTYVAAFDANIESVARYVDGDAPYPRHAAELVARAELTFLGGELVLLDDFSLQDRERTHLTVTAPRRALAQAVSVLSDGGRVVKADDDASRMTIEDRFGVVWHFVEESAPHPASELSPRSA